MSTTTRRLKKTLVVLVAVMLMLLPNLIAFADETTGVQGTPTPEQTAQATASTEVASSPENSESASPINTTTPEGIPEKAEESETTSPENSESASPVNTTTPEGIPEKAQESETTSPENSESASPVNTTTPEATTEKAEESETTSPENSESASPVNTTTPEGIPEKAEESETTSPENSESASPVNTTTPEGIPEKVQESETTSPETSESALPSDATTPEGVPEKAQASETTSPSDTTSPETSPTADELLLVAPAMQVEGASAQRSISSNLNFKLAEGLDHYSYSYTYYYRERVGGPWWNPRYETRSKTESGTVSGGGSISVRNSDILTFKSTSVTIQAFGKANYNFKNWKNHFLSGNPNPTTFDMPIFAVNVKAQFEKAPVYHNVTFNYGDGKSNVQSILDGEDATPPDPTRTGYRFLGWNPSRGWTNVTTDGLVFDATYVKTYTLTFDQPVGSGQYEYDGKLYSAGESVLVDKNSKVTIKAVADKHFASEGWVTPSATTETVEFTMLGDTSVKAKFKQIEFKLTFEDADNLGHYEYAGNHNGGDSIYVKAGALVTVNAVATKHYAFDSWETTPSADSSANPTTFTMPSNDTSVKAKFKLFETKLTFESAEGLSHYTFDGKTYNGGDSLYVEIDSKISITAYPAKHYINDSWAKYPTGASIELDTLNHTMPNEDTNVQAKFKVSEYAMNFVFSTGIDFYSYTIDGGAAQFVSSAQTTYLPADSSVAVTAHAKEAYAFDYWDRNTNADSTTANIASFTMNSAKTSSAVFKEDGYHLYLVGGPLVKTYIIKYNATTITQEYAFNPLLIPKNIDVTVTAIGEDNTVFDFWYEGSDTPSTALRNGTNWAFTMNADYVMKAHFDIIDIPEPFPNGNFIVQYSAYSGSTGGGNVQVYYPDSSTLAGTLSPGGSVNIKYQDGKNTVTLKAVPNTGSAFVKWTNHAGITTPTMTLDIPTGQGQPQAAPAARSLERAFTPFEITINVSPQFEKLGSLTIQKVDTAGKAIKNVTFTLSGPDGYSTALKTDKAGTIIWPNLKAGNYTLTETVPSGYYLETANSMAISIGSGEDKELDPIVNYKYGRLVITKKDSAGNVMKGVKFTLTGPNGYSKTKTSNVNGILRFGSIKPGIYTLTEVVPDGYYLDGSNTETYTFTQGQVIKETITNYKYGSLQITKIDSFEAEMEGVSFTLTYPNGTTSTQVTNANGVVLWENLKPGTYSLEESVPSGYYLTTDNPLEIIIAQGEDVTKTITNNQFVTIQAQKKSNFTGNALAGAEFKIAGADGVQIGTTQTSGSDGMVAFGAEYKLRAGVAYTVTEVSPPDGYQNDSSPITITLKSPGSTNEVAVFANTPILQSITVMKYLDKVFVGDIGNGFLDGTQFELWKDGALVDTKFLLSGKCEFTNLLPGEYIIKEIAGPTTTYLTIDSGKEVTLYLPTGSNVEEGVVDPTVDFTNTYDPADFAFVKSDSENENRVLSGAVYHLTGMKWNGTSFVATTYQMTTNSSGYAEVRGITPGEYTLKEVTAPFGYAVDPTVYNINILPNRSTEEIYHVSDDEYELGTIVIAKKIGDSLYALEGAKFELYKVHLGVETLIASATTNPQGNIIWGDLQAGTYVIKEVSAPAGYTIREASRTMTLAPGDYDIQVFRNDGPLPTTSPEIVINREPVPAAPESTPTPTPVPTATPTPIPDDELTIEDVDPAYGPETGEGDTLFLLIGILLLMAATLFVVRKKIVLKK